MIIGVNTNRSFSVLDMLSSDSVQGSSSLIWNDSGIDFKSISFLILLDVFLLLQLLKSPSDDLGAGVIVVLWGTSSSLEATIEMGEKTNSGSRAEIDLASKGGNSIVNPIIIKRSQFASYITKVVLVAVLTKSAHAGLSIRLFFLRYWANASMNSRAEISFTVKKVCWASPSMWSKILKIIYLIITPTSPYPSPQEKSRHSVFHIDFIHAIRIFPQPIDEFK